MVSNEFFKIKSISHQPRLPLFPCMQCKTGRLSVKDDLRYYPTEFYVDDTDQWYDTEDGYFSADLTCDNYNMRRKEEHCDGRIFITGSLICEDRFNPEYKILSMQPALRLIVIPAYFIGKEGFADFLKQIDIASGAYWLDNSLCAATLRKSLELLLDTYNVPRKGKKENFITLERRIDCFLEQNDFGKRISVRIKEIPKFLRALREIGNDGTHETNMSDDNLFLMWELVQFILSAIDSINQESSLVDRTTS